MHEAQVEGGPGHEALHPLARDAQLRRLSIASQGRLEVHTLRQELHLIGAVHRGQREVGPISKKRNLNEINEISHKIS